MERENEGRKITKKEEIGIDGWMDGWIDKM